MTSPGNNDKATVLVLGDILILRKKGLRTVAWDSFFPVNDAPFRDRPDHSPVEIVRAIQDARDGLDPVRFPITGNGPDINVRMGVKPSTTKNGPENWATSTIRSNCRNGSDYSPRRIVHLEPKKPAQAKEPEATRETPGRRNRKDENREGQGDCLWNIAKKFYGKGSDYTKIYNANKGTIGSEPESDLPRTGFHNPVISILYQNNVTGDAFDVTTLCAGAKWSTKRSGSPASLELTVIVDDSVTWTHGGIVALDDEKPAFFTATS